jgi:hypothetical protein
VILKAGFQEVNDLAEKAAPEEPEQSIWWNDKKTVRKAAAKKAPTK